MNDNKIRFILGKLVGICCLIFFFIAIFVVFFREKPWTLGDGGEYMLQTVAIQNHLSFGITLEDLLIAKKQFSQIDVDGNLFDRVVSHKDNNNGVIYLNHFGAYSLLVTPVKLLLLTIDVDPQYAFKITNILLWLFSCLIVFFCLKIEGIKKFILLLLLLFNPILFYVTWIHSEVYLFSFMVIGLVFYYNRNYGLGILFVSLAAMQNIGVLPMGMVMGIDYIISLYHKFCIDEKASSCRMFVRRYWKKIISYGIFYVPVFIPMIVSYINQGVFNKVASVALEKSFLLSKMGGYLFDLNMGIFPYEPIILLFFLVMIVYGMYKGKKSAILNLLAVMGMLFVVSLEKQINCGMQAIMRYNVWIIPCMIFYVVMHIDLNKKKMFFALITEAFLTLAIVIYTLYGCGNYECYYVKFMPWTRAVLNYVPYLYNPNHAIFISRVKNIEAYGTVKPVIYLNENEYVRKILLNREEGNDFYKDNIFILQGDNADRIIDITTMKKFYVDDGQFKYINVTKPIQYYTRYKGTIYFYGERYNADQYVRKGLSVKESRASWMEGNKFQMNLYFDEKEDEFLEANIDILGVFYQSQRVKILVNDSEIYSGTVEEGRNQNIRFRFRNSNLVRFVIILPDAISPSTISESFDSRMLSLYVRSIEFTRSSSISKNE